jgi:tungstate transport system ATP-binding protein
MSDAGRPLHADGRAPGTPTASSPDVVRVRDLVLTRAGRRVLEVDDLAVREGETLAVVGPNGAGKSTLILALAGLLRPERGELAFRGGPVPPGGDLAYRRRIGLVLPAPLLLSTSVRANVAAGLRFRGVPAAEAGRRADIWLGRLGIAHLAERPAAQVSSGEAQRASLARAFVLEPELLLLDEPFASVDSTTRVALVDDFARLRAGTPGTCVLVTHDLDEAVRLGDRLAVLLDGRIRQCDTPDRVLAAPADEDVAAFVGVEARIRGRVVAAADGLVVIDVGGGRRGDADRGADAAALLRAVSAASTILADAKAADSETPDTEALAGASPSDARPPAAR